MENWHWSCCLDFCNIQRKPETQGEQECAHLDGDFSAAQVNVTLSVSPRWTEADNHPEECEAEHKGWILSLLPWDWVWCRLRFPAENRNRQPWHGPEDFWKSGDFSPNEGEFLLHCLWNSPVLFTVVTPPARSSQNPSFLLESPARYQSYFTSSGPRYSFIISVTHTLLPCVVLIFYKTALTIKNYFLN